MRSFEINFAIYRANIFVNELSKHYLFVHFAFGFKIYK